MDLLDTLVSQTDTTPAVKSAAHLPLKTLVEWYFADCEARNLSAKTLRFYRQKMAYLVQGAGERTAQSIEPTHLQLLVNHYRKERKWSVGTVNHTITAWRVFFEYLCEEGILEVSPARRMKKLKADETLPIPLSDDEVRRLLDAIPVEGYVALRMRAMVLLFIDTGVRLGEMLSMTPAAVDLTSGGQVIVNGKSRKERSVPFSPQTRRALLKYLAVRKPQEGVTALWLTDEGTPLNEFYVYHSLQALGKTAGIDGLHPHRLRHTFATAWLRNGGSLEMLQRCLGHSSERMSLRYAHLCNLEPAAMHRTASPIMKIYAAS